MNESDSLCRVKETSHKEHILCDSIYVKWILIYSDNKQISGFPGPGGYRGMNYTKEHK